MQCMFDLSQKSKNKNPTIGDAGCPNLIESELVDSGHVLICAQFFIVDGEITW